MLNRSLFVFAFSALLVQIPQASAQPAKGNPLKDAEAILNSVRTTAMSGLAVSYLAEPAPKVEVSSLVGTKWLQPPQFDRGGSYLEFISPTKVKRTGISPTGVYLKDVETVTEWTWRQNSDGSIVIGDNGYRGTYKTGQSELSLTYGQPGAERTITYRLVK